MNESDFRGFISAVLVGACVLFGGALFALFCIRDELCKIRQNMDLAPIAAELSEKGIGPR